MKPALQDRRGRQFDKQTIFQGAVDSMAGDSSKNEEFSSARICMDVLLLTEQARD